jgi:hypothetical protein
MKIWGFVSQCPGGEGEALHKDLGMTVGAVDARMLEFENV